MNEFLRNVNALQYVSVLKGEEHRSDDDYTYDDGKDDSYDDKDYKD